MPPQIGPGTQARVPVGKSTIIVAGGIVVVTIGYYKLSEYLALDSSDSAPPQTRAYTSAPQTWIYTSSPDKMGFEVDRRPSNLFNRVQQRELSMQAAKGKSFGTGALSLTVTNKTSRAIEVQVPKGTFFGNKTSGSQPLIVSEDLTLHLNPSEEKSLRLDAFCGVGSFRLPRDNDMDATSLVLAVPDVMRSQEAVWSYLNKYYPVRALDLTRNEPTHHEAASAEQYYFKYRNKFAEFENKCNTGQRGTSQWLEHFSDAGIIRTGSDITHIGDTGVIEGRVNGEEKTHSALFRAMGELALRIALESNGGGNGRPQIDSGGNTEVRTKADSKPKQIDSGSAHSK